MPNVSSFCWSSFYFTFIHSPCLPRGLVPLCYTLWNHILLWIYWPFSEDFTFIDSEVWPSNNPAAIQKRCYGDNVKEFYSFSVLGTVLGTGVKVMKKIDMDWSCVIGNLSSNLGHFLEEKWVLLIIMLSVLVSCCHKRLHNKLPQSQQLVTIVITFSYSCVCKLSRKTLL